MSWPHNSRSPADENSPPSLPGTRTGAAAPTGVSRLRAPSASSDTQGQQGARLEGLLTASQRLAAELELQRVDHAEAQRRPGVESARSTQSEGEEQRLREKALAEAAAENARLTQAYQEDVTRAEAALAEAVAAAQRKSEEHAAAISALTERAHHDVQNAAREAAALRAELAAKDTQLSRTHEDLEKALQRSLTSDAIRNDFALELSQAKNELEALHSQVETLKAQLSDAESISDNARKSWLSEREDLTRQLETRPLVADLAARDARIQVLAAQLELAQEEAEDLAEKYRQIKSTRLERPSAYSTRSAEQMAELASHVDTLALENNHIQGRITELEQQNRRLEAQCLMADQLVHEARLAEGAAKRRVGILDFELVEALAANEALGAELARVSESAASARSCNHDAALAEKDAELARITREFATAQATITEMDARYLSALSELKSSTASLESVQESSRIVSEKSAQLAGELSSKIRLLEEQLAQAKREAETLTAERALAADQVASLSASRDDAVRECEHLAQQLALIQQQRLTDTDEQSKYAQTAHELSSKIRSFEEQLAQAEVKAKVLLLEREHAIAQVRAADELRRDAQLESEARLETAFEKTRDLEAELSARNKRLTYLEGVVDQLEAKLATGASSIERLSREAAESAAEACIARADVEQLQQDLALARQDLLARSDEQAAERESQNTALAALRGQLANTEAEAKNAVAAAAAQVAEIAREHSRSLEHAHDARTGLESELSMARSRLGQLSKAYETSEARLQGLLEHFAAQLRASGRESVPESTDAAAWAAAAGDLLADLARRAERSAQAEEYAEKVQQLEHFRMTAEQERDEARAAEAASRLALQEARDLIPDMRAKAEEKIALLNQAVEDLGRRDALLAEREAFISHLQAEHQAAQARVQELETQLDQAESSLRQFEQSQEEYLHRAAYAELALEDLREATERDRSEFAQQIKNYESDMTTTRATLEKYEEMLLLAKSTIDEVTADKEAAAAAAESERRRANEEHARLEQLDQRLLQVQREHQELIHAERQKQLELAHALQNSQTALEKAMLEASGLQTRLDDARRRYDDLLEQHEASERRLNVERASVDVQCEILDKASLEKSALTVAQLKREAEAATAVVNQLSDELDRQKTRERDAAAQAAEKINTLVDELGRTKADLADARSQLEQMLRDHQAARSKLVDQVRREEAAERAAAINELEAKLKEARSAADTSRGQANSLVKTVEQLTAEKTTVEAQKADLELRVEQLSSQTRALQDRIDALVKESELSKQQHDADLEVFNRQAAELDKLAAKASLESKLLATQRDELEDRLIFTERQLHDIREHAKQLTEQLAASQSKLVQTQATLGEAHAQADLARANAARAEAAAASLGNTLGGGEDLSQNGHELERMLQRFAAENDLLQSKHIKYLKTIESLELRCERLKAFIRKHDQLARGPTTTGSTTGAAPRPSPSSAGAAALKRHRSTHDAADENAVAAQQTSVNLQGRRGPSPKKSRLDGL
ncbi:hypothetical protein HK105_202819 [Polyrhizophydium stewartii]|uniref:Uncharacterized protein n=1 Tax=Polyrhizophydium stewartii TaxID=2732419 RepID=A0ABR4NDK8_9FUNG